MNTRGITNPWRKRVKRAQRRLRRLDRSGVTRVVPVGTMLFARTVPTLVILAWMRLQEAICNAVVHGYHGYRDLRSFAQFAQDRVTAAMSVDALQGFSPDDIIVGPHGQTLTQAARADELTHALQDSVEPELIEVEVYALPPGEELAAHVDLGDELVEVEATPLTSWASCQECKWHYGMPVAMCEGHFEQKLDNDAEQQAPHDLSRVECGLCTRTGHRTANCPYLKGV